MAYNGWKNYETWVVNLWLTNDEVTYRTCTGMADEAQTDASTCKQVRDRIWQPEDAAKFLLSDKLKELVEEHSPLASDASMYCDLLNAALSEVDWHEIAEAFLCD